MKVGITGTRSGCTDKQLLELIEYLYTLNATELHHGDCIGVDVEVADVAHRLGIKIVCHPPVKTDLRGYYEHVDYEYPPLSYFARNRKIVDETNILLVVPYQSEWQSSGGTWYTHDYAKKQNKPIKIFWP